MRHWRPLAPRHRCLHNRVRLARCGSKSSVNVPTANLISNALQAYCLEKSLRSMILILQVCLGRMLRRHNVNERMRGRYTYHRAGPNNTPHLAATSSRSTIETSENVQKQRVACSFSRRCQRQGDIRIMPRNFETATNLRQFISPVKVLEAGPKIGSQNPMH